MTTIFGKAILTTTEYQCIAVLLALLPVHFQWNVNRAVIYQYYTARFVLHGASNFQIAIVIGISFTRGHRVLSSSSPLRYRLRKHKQSSVCCAKYRGLRAAIYYWVIHQSGCKGSGCFACGLCLQLCIATHVAYLTGIMEVMDFNAMYGGFNLVRSQLTAEHHLAHTMLEVQAYCLRVRFSRLTVSLGKHDVLLVGYRSGYSYVGRNVG